MICTNSTENGNYGIKFPDVVVPKDTSQKNDKVIGSWKRSTEGGGYIAFIVQRKSCYEGHSRENREGTEEIF